MLLRCRYQDHSRCPCCGQEDEDTLHVLRCNEAGAKIKRNEAIRELDKWMHKKATAPPLLEGIIDRVSSWLLDVPPMPVNCYDSLQQEAFAEQDQMGWWNFLLGRMSSKFAKSQDEYYKRIGSRQGGKRWLTALIQKMWDVSWDLWEHRNGIAHTDMTPARIEELHDLRLQAKEEFAKGTTNLGSLDHCRLADQQQVLSLRLLDLQSWLRGIRLARQSYIDLQDHNRQRLQRSRALMTAWLTGNPQS